MQVSLLFLEGVRPAPSFRIVLSVRIRHIKCLQLPPTLVSAARE
jgi:hypothetical protein